VHRGREHHIRVGPVLLIEKRIAADRNLGIDLGDLAELHTNVALARIARTVPESMRTPVLSLGATSSSIACMIEGTPAITMTLAIQKPSAPDIFLRIRSTPARHLTDHQKRGRDNLFGSG
jgi:hypothetical protein